jgi:hypothetical protein
LALHLFFTYFSFSLIAIERFFRFRSLDNSAPSTYGLGYNLTTVTIIKMAKVEMSQVEKSKRGTRKSKGAIARQIKRRRGTREQGVEQDDVALRAPASSASCSSSRNIKQIQQAEVSNLKQQASSCTSLATRQQTTRYTLC